MAVPPIKFSGFNYGHFNPSLGYLYDPVIQAYRAVEPSDFAATLIASGINVDITGVETVGVTGGWIGTTGGILGITGNVKVTGSVDATILGGGQIGISGGNVGVSGGFVGVSGNVKITGSVDATLVGTPQVGLSGFTFTNPLNVSGGITGSVLILPSPNLQVGVSGFTNSAQPLYTTGTSNVTLVGGSVGLSGQPIFITGNTNATTRFEAVTGVLFTGLGANVIGIARTGVPTAVADGFAVQPWFDDVGRQVMYGADVSQGVISVTDVAPALTQSLNTTLTTLSTLSGTQVVDISNYSYVTVQMTFSNLTGEISGEIKFSVDNSNFYQGILETTAMSGLNIAANRFGVTGVGSITRGISAKKQGNYCRIDLLNSGSDAGSWSCVPKIYASRV